MDGTTVTRDEVLRGFDALADIYGHVPPLILWRAWEHAVYRKYPLTEPALDIGFNPEYTGRDNVYINASIFGLTREETDARFDAIAAFADIGEFLDQPVKMYSSGTFVRLAVAVATSVDADVLLIDEALAVGDVFFTQKRYRHLESLIDRGVAIVLVSHDATAISQFRQDAALPYHRLCDLAGDVRIAVIASSYDGSAAGAPAEPKGSSGTSNA